MKTNRNVFNDLTLNEGALSFSFTEPFQILHDTVLAINSSKLIKTEKKLVTIFKPLKKPDVTLRSGAFSASRSNWLPIVDEVRTFLQGIT